MEDEGVPASATDPWTGLLQQLGVASSGGASAPAESVSRPSLVQRDEKTGETYLKLPVPPEVLNQALEAFGALLQSLQK